MFCLNSLTGQLMTSQLTSELNFLHMQSSYNQSVRTQYRIARNVRGQKFSRISRMVFQSRKLFFAKFTSTFRYYNYTPSSQILSADAIFRRTRLAHVFGGSLLCLSVCSSFNLIASSLLFSSVLVRFIC